MKLIFTSYGLTTRKGRELIGEEIAKDQDISRKKIFIFHEPFFSTECLIKRTCLEMGFEESNIIFSGYQSSNQDLLDMDYIYVGSGNTFEILTLLRERNLVDFIRAAVERNCTYIGTSAGAIIAGSSVEEAVRIDRNEVEMTDFQGLSLFRGIILPHYSESELAEVVNCNPELKQKYDKILSVDENEILILKDGIICRRVYQ
ncbi:MAG: Type 1 glutamine amidotransferase-like domain-containing protein [Lachnospiraceae bacterium]|nr:Type 1 glutamine amidotransferase-like domain-containing protein [Lachnospiraceae bacterium]